MRNIIRSVVLRKKLLLDDIVGVFSYSLRRLNSSYLGFCIRVRRSSDNAELDVGFIQDELDVAALLSFVGSVNAFVVIWYDQTSGKNAVQSNPSFQPLIVSNGVLVTINGCPSIVGDGINDTMAILGTPTTYPVSISIVQSTFGSSKGCWVKVGGLDSGNGIGIGVGDKSFDSLGTNILGLKEFISWLPTVITAGTSSILYIQPMGISPSTIYRNSRQSSISSGSTSSPIAPTNESAIFGYLSSNRSRHSNSKISELLIFSSALDESIGRTIQNNQINYYGL